MAHELSHEEKEKIVSDVLPGPKSAGKLKQSVVLYMPKALIDKAGDGPGARCGKCMMFLTDISACSILDPEKVDGDKGVCGLFVGGEPVTSKDHKPMKFIPAEVAGYEEGGMVPTHCGRCKYFESPASCKKVEGTVEDGGCCNHYEVRA